MIRLKNQSARKHTSGAHRFALATAAVVGIGCHLLGQTADTPNIQRGICQHTASSMSGATTQPGVGCQTPDGNVLDMLFDANDGVLANSQATTLLANYVPSLEQNTSTVTKEMPILDWVNTTEL